MLCNHHLSLFPELFHHSKQNIWDIFLCCFLWIKWSSHCHICSLMDLPISATSSEKFSPIPFTLELGLLFFGFFLPWHSGQIIMTYARYYDYRFMRFFHWTLKSLKSLTDSFIFASLASSIVPAVSKWLDSASYHLCKLALAHMLALNENQVAGLKEIS